jgi:hypothetical protein
MMPTFAWGVPLRHLLDEGERRQPFTTAPLDQWHLAILALAGKNCQPAGEEF